MNHYTSIEQSKKLVELGLNPDTADMHYIKCIRENDVRYIPELLLDDNECDIPCWSLGALLELMPASIEEVKDHNVDLILGPLEDKWEISYFDWTGLQHGPSIISDTPLEAAYNMVIWLLENDYIKKGD